jgi:hypothetical protein
MLKYIELKTGHADNGPAWVARVKASKSDPAQFYEQANADGMQRRTDRGRGQSDG